jgi:hypothetical protein
MTEAATAPASATPPTLDDRIAAIDALAVADRIGRQALRGAMAASSIEIVALARRLLRLEGCAAATFELLTSIDRMHDDPKAPDIAQQRRAVFACVEQIGNALGALGYVPQELTQDQSPKPATETIND